ncbi:MAG TPA: ABC transporter permease [Candidatus Limnocylindrales bacterium]|nr:ABC transporter permease [Candidatus Limnocylindrales bacterium]
MIRLREIVSRLRGFILRRGLDHQLDHEISEHLDLLAEDNIRRGMAPEEARNAARRQFGRMDTIKETYRKRRGLPMLETFLQDLNFGARTLRKNPGFTAVALLTFALGIGATTLVFSIFYAALLKPMPFRDAKDLVELNETRLARGIDTADFSEANFWDIRSQNHSFSEVASYHYDEANMTGEGDPEKIHMIHVTNAFFRTLGVSPILGRDFSYEDDRQKLTEIAILGNRFWKERFGGNPSILGKFLRLDNQAYTVVGVLPPGEPWIDEQLYVPFSYRSNPGRASWEFSVIGRLAPGASINSANADLESVASALDRAYPADDKGIGFKITPSSAWGASASARLALWVLLGAVTFLLAIGCINIANLLLARGMTRQREIAMRRALGASRFRLVSLVLVESLMLSGVGALLGLAIAYGGLIAIQALEVNDVPGLLDANLNLRVLGFSALIAIVTGLISGCALAIRAPRVDVSAVFRSGDHIAGNRVQARLRAALVAGEIALSALLLVCSGLLVRSLTNLINVKSGFQTENRLIFTANLPGSYYEKGVGKQFLDNLFTRLNSLPGVISVGAISHRPVEGGNPGMTIDSSEAPSAGTQHKAPWAGWRVVTPGYFDAVGLPLIRGRIFVESDKQVWGIPGQPIPARRVVISEKLASLIFPNQDPIGRHAELWKGQSNLDAEVIGVVGDSHERGLSKAAPRTVYLPYGPTALPGEIVLHTRGNPLSLVPAVRSVVGGLDPNLPVSDLQPLLQVVEHSIAPQRFNTGLLAVFSSLALLLAAIGVYGVISYTVVQQTREWGVRLALGAEPRDLLSLVLARGLRLAAIGLAIGLALSLAGTRLIGSLLFGVNPMDPLTFVAAALVLATVALAACWIPARRAMRIDPAEALRHE